LKYDFWIVLKYLAYILIFVSFAAPAQNDSLFIKVHFLYGSRPLKQFKSTETKHFGGKHGGHVSIELDNVDYGFGPSNGSFHLFAHKKKPRSSFDTKNSEGKPAYMGGWKYASVWIPLTEEQYDRVKQVLENYTNKSPYDYAFFGMRCASATHDILAQTGILKSRSNFYYILTTFYPKKLRKRLFRLAETRSYKIIKQEGRTTRKWEKD
jgi:hypothetical protein